MRRYDFFDRRGKKGDEVKCPHCGMMTTKDHVRCPCCRKNIRHSQNSKNYFKEACPFCGGKVNRETRCCVTCNIAFPKGQGVSIKWTISGYGADSDEGGPSWENGIKEIESD
jgi:rRNA maturation protein Nop10